MEYIYAVIKDKESKKLNLIKSPIEKCKCDEETLCGYFDYATDLQDAYCSCISPIEVEFLRYNYIIRGIRQDAYNMQEAIKKVRENNNIVAHSHRYGGFTHFDWNFGENVTFHIYTNFGYGSNSDFNSTFKYKNTILAPYSYYVKYRNSDYASVVSCTHQYRLKYEEWYQVMKDCLEFYNAIVNKEEKYVFEWIDNQLSIMVAGLEEFVNCNEYHFFDEKWNYRVSKMALITEDDFWAVKSKKIANSLAFVENIKILPIQINNQSYIDRLVNLCKKFDPLLNDKIIKTRNIVKIKEMQLEFLKNNDDYRIYDRIKEKYYWKKQWYISANQFKMIWFLMHFSKRFNYKYDKSNIRERIILLKKRIDDVNKAKSDLEREKTFLSNLEKNLEIMKHHIEHNS